jgi:hypothetical protein
VVVSASRRLGDRRRFIVAAGGIATLAGALGCFMMGFAGVAAMFVALAAVSVPAALRPARA